MNLPRVGVICDLREENWPSMDLVADMLLEHLQRDYADTIAARRICPPMQRRLFSQRSEIRGQAAEGRRQKAEGGKQWRSNADRFLNRFWDYPRFVRQLKSDFDLFHLVDHSYAQLLHELPAGRTLVTCHDLDTFQCLLNPGADPRSIWFKKMMSRTLSGFQKAARVICVSNSTRDELIGYQLISPDRAVVIPNGVHPSCSPEPDEEADAAIAELIGPANLDAVNILHVGSTIPRKRIDFLLRVFKNLRDEVPEARLIRVGGSFSLEQLKLVDELGLANAIVELGHLDRSQLAAVYRRAAVLLLPSEREGFGLPVVEAMACGTPVVASDLPSLRETGGEAAVYCPVNDLSSWTSAVIHLLDDNQKQSQAWFNRRAASLAQSQKFSWAEYARKTVAIYQELL